MKQYLTFLLCMTAVFAHAQNVGIGTKHPQNKLHVAGGVRVDSLAAKKDSGIILHNKTGDLYSVSLTGKKADVLRGDGTFAAAAAPTDAWLLGGNAATDSATDFVGTIDDRPLRFRVNNEWFGSLGTNVAFGRLALAPNVVGGNVAIGDSALFQTTNGTDNVAVGKQAMRVLAGSNNTALGARALKGPLGASAASSGNSNTAVGTEALTTLNSGSYNTAIGENALRWITTSSENTAIGYGSQHGFADAEQRGIQNVSVGSNSMTVNLGSHNTAIGTQSMRNAITAFYCTALGYRTLYHNGFGKSNTATGTDALFYNGNGSYNTATGARSLYNNSRGSYNAAMGYLTLEKNDTGQHNAALGAYALLQNKGSFNTSVGSNAVTSNTTGRSLTAAGYRALFSNTTGASNTSIGVQSMSGNTTGGNNAALGYGALKTNVSGWLNTAVGMLADVTSASLSNATAIGYGAKVNASNKVRIGNASVTVIEGQVPFTTPSDGRFKYNVKEDVSGLDFILKLRPVTYQFDVKRFDNIGDVTFASVKNSAYDKAALIRRTGFIAQEVEKAAAETNYDFSGVIKPENEKEHYSLSYESFVVPLVKGMQEQNSLITGHEIKITRLMETVEAQNEQLKKQQQVIEQQQQIIDELLKNRKKG